MSEFELPSINWIKNDPLKFNSFSDGSVFLVAYKVRIDGDPPVWAFDVVEVGCDDERMNLYFRDKVESYDGWDWECFEYFALLEGDMPTFDEED